MSLSFTCPSCKAHMEVPDDLAGQSGQCPRCQHVFTIPSPKAPPFIPVGKPVAGAPTKIPPYDPWAKEPARDDSRPLSSAGRPRRARAMPPQPSGPVWPWLVGILGALVVGGLLFASFLVLVAWRKPMSFDHRNAIKQQIPPVVVQNQRVTVGRFDGQRAFFFDGVFQVKADLSPNDPQDPTRFGCKRKRYDIELRAFQNYAIEVDGAQFDPRIRLEPMNDFPRESGGFNRNTLLFYTPQFNNQMVTIYVSSNQPANGQFTLTVREQHRQKPFFP